MKINIDFLVVSYIIGLFIDWIFQWNWQAVNKSKWNKNDNKIFSLWAVGSHSFIYSILTSLISLWITNGLIDFWVVFIILFITHAIIDTRIPVKAIMYFKGMKKEQIYDYQTYGFMHIGIDHRLHELVLLVISLLIR